MGECVFKVFAFLQRHPNLSHDEYRAGHVGYHCGQSRRLKNIRGYLVNIWSNEPFADKVGGMYDELVFNEPLGFTDLWDGFPQVYFDSQADWVAARTAEPTRAMVDGLVVDPDWSLADPWLFRPAPDDPNQFCSFHLHMEETVVVPVRRPERKLTKLMHFFRRRADLDDERFIERWQQTYLPLLGSLPGLYGCLGNLRDPDEEAAMRDFFPPEAWVFSAAGTQERRDFCALWRGAHELWFDSMHDFLQARQRLGEALLALEQELFDAQWYVEVDENLIVLPNRAPRPEFYFR